MRRVVPGVYQLEAAGFVNAYLIEGSEDLTLVDAGPARSAEDLAGELEDNGFRLRDVGRAVVTHAHADHAGGLAPLLERHRFKVYAHPADIPVLTGKAPSPPPRGLRGSLLGLYHRRFLPWEPVDSALALEPGASVRALPQWQVVHLPGHTPGSIGLFQPVKQVLLCGDALSCRGGLHLPADGYNQDPAAARASLAALARMDCDVLCPGHGPALRSGAFRWIEKLLDGKNPDII